MIFADAVPAGQAVAQITKGAASFGPDKPASASAPPSGPGLLPEAPFAFWPTASSGGSSYTTPLLALGGVALAGVAGFLIWKKMKG